MTIDLPSVVEDQLRDLAKRQNRDIAELIEDAVCQYLEARCHHGRRPEPGSRNTGRATW
jgi:hypothetical protein